ncbi:DUF2333 family protein [Thiohalocapsa sp. ML1]|jgi:hypothetical protein|uniref:DUF2333 family protein n=1 Tax=Thiohalocapsa sp. ML1 TaxID=1431688 RepID=UPI0007321866|nr:DUF2333 family protein [Thiohalocapsa sp. ML1]
MKQFSAATPPERRLGPADGSMSAQPAQATPQTTPRARGARGGPWRWLLAAAGVVLVLNLTLMLWWGWQPDPFDVAEVTRAELQQSGGEAVPGTAFTAATIAIGETLLHKPGGFLHNDRLPPGALMKNGPSWECGGVMAIRDAVQALRDGFSRAQSQSIENLDVKRADMRFAMDPKAWVLPAAEGSYQEGTEALRAYFADLANGRAVFHPRADSLADYLRMVEKRLGNFGVRLGAAVGGGLAPIGIGEGSAAGAGNPGGDLESRRVTEVFYCARGYAWSLLHLMRAVEQDFGPMLADKHAEAQVARIIQDLSGAIKRLRSPVVLNGNGLGFFANHSMVAASYIARVNAAMIDLRLLMEQG